MSGFGPRTAPAPHGGGWRASLSSLRNPQFRWLYASNMAFFFAMGSQGVVRGWLAFRLTQSEFALGVVMFAVAVPMFCIAPFGGVAGDRFERRTLIVLGQAAVVASELTILLLILTERVAFWHLVAGASVMGCAFPFIMPARQAIVFNIVGRDGLPNAVALNMAGMNATRVVGPAAGGFLIAALGLKGTYALGVMLYVAGLLCMFGVDASRGADSGLKRPVVESLAEGARYVRDHRLVLVLLLFGLIPMFLAMPFQNLLVVFAEKIWEVGASGLGMLSASAGLGGTVGSLWIASRSGTSRRLRRMMISMIGFGSLLFAFALSPWFLLGLPLAFLANVCASVYGTLNSTAIQLLIPDHVRSRISSFLMMSFSLPMLGTLPMAAVAQAMGAPFAVALASVLATGVALLFYAGSPVLRTMDTGIRTALEPPPSAAGR